MKKYYILKKNEIESIEKMAAAEGIRYCLVEKTIFNDEEVAIYVFDLPENGTRIVENFIDRFIANLRKENQKKTHFDVAAIPRDEINTPPVGATMDGLKFVKITSLLIG